jgi:branched-chain amino acid transport system substrate-binding protein
LASAGGDTINAIMQAAEFGIVQGGQRLAGLFIYITDIHSLGLKTAQGLVFTRFQQTLCPPTWRFCT